MSEYGDIYIYRYRYRYALVQAGRLAFILIKDSMAHGLVHSNSMQLLNEW